MAAASAAMPPAATGRSVRIAGKARLLNADLPVVGLANRASLRHDEGAQGHPARARRAFLAACGGDRNRSGAGMDAAKETQMIREAVGVFHDRDSFEDAVDDLLSAGFDRSELSLLASEQAVEQKLGHAYEKVQELEDDAGVPRAAFVGNHSLAEARTGIIGGLAYIGAMVATGAVVASGGGLLGGWAARFLGRDRAKHLQHQLDHGGLLLWVRVRDEAHERRALEILTRSGAEDVHVHELPASEVPAENPLSGVELDPFLPGARI